MEHDGCRLPARPNPRKTRKLVKILFKSVDRAANLDDQNHDELGRTLQPQSTCVDYKHDLPQSRLLQSIENLN